MKISARFMRRFACFLSISVLLAPLTALAQTGDFYVISANRKLKNIVTVARAGGDFTDPVAAVNSITDASATNPYVVVIGPGVYTITQTLVMREHVDIVGSGENVTRLTGAISTVSDESSAIISGVGNATLNSITVENTGGSDYSIALYNAAAYPKVSHVTATASGGTYSYGIYNYYYSSPTMTDVIATASGGTYSYGIYNNFYSSPTMTDVTANASGGSSYNCAVFNSTGSSPTMTDVTAKASGGSDSYGVYSSSSSPAIRRCTMDGGTSGLDGGSPATVSQSTIIGGVGGTGTKTCVACDDGSGVALNANCTTP